jgi:protein-tyrosine phosphatase
MENYKVSWITANLAVGHAPFSYEDLDAIKSQGIDAIANLCDEFCDLHEIEQSSGFEVYYLPIPDDSAPDVQEMEKALAWLDEAIYLGKKVLVHCRFGIGRTGTFVTAYLLRRGLGLKLANKKMKHTRATPSSYHQHRLLKRYGKLSGRLKVREPSLESKHVVDLGVYFLEYEAFVAGIETAIAPLFKDKPSCGDTSDSCCFGYIELDLMEALYLHNRANRKLTANLRKTIVDTSAAIDKKVTGLRRELAAVSSAKEISSAHLTAAYALLRQRCPLSHKKRCLLFEHRPIACRTAGIDVPQNDEANTKRVLNELSQTVFHAFSGQLVGSELPRFSLPETLSGRFVATYFRYMANQQGNLASIP